MQMLTSGLLMMALASGADTRQAIVRGQDGPEEMVESLFEQGPRRPVRRRDYVPRQHRGRYGGMTSPAQRLNYFPFYHGVLYQRPVNYRNFFDYPWHIGVHTPLRKPSKFPAGQLLPSERVVAPEEIPLPAAEHPLTPPDPPPDVSS